MNKLLIVATVLLVGILLPAFGEEIQIDESDLIGTWDLITYAAVGYDEEELLLQTHSAQVLFSVSLESDGFGKIDGASNFVWRFRYEPGSRDCFPSEHSGHFGNFSKRQYQLQIA